MRLFFEEPLCINYQPFSIKAQISRWKLACGPTFLKTEIWPWVVVIPYRQILYFPVFSLPFQLIVTFLFLGQLLPITLLAWLLRAFGLCPLFCTSVWDSQDDGSQMFSSYAFTTLWPCHCSLTRSCSKISAHLRMEKNRKYLRSKIQIDTLALGWIFSLLPLESSPYIRLLCGPKAS